MTAYTLELQRVASQLSANSVVAFLDVDHTLIGGNYVTDNPHSIAACAKAIERPGVMNEALLTALTQAKISDIYLFTDMTFSETMIVERLALINVLTKKGFRLHGVITPPDPAWHIEQKSLEEFYESEATMLPKKIDVALEEKDNKSIDTFSHELKRIMEGDAYRAITENKKMLIPGNAFAEAATLVQDKISNESKWTPDERRAYEDRLATIKSKSVYAKSFVDFQSVGNDLSHVKGVMFQQILVNHPVFKTCLIFDDNTKVLESVKKINDQSIQKLKLVTVYVNNQLSTSKCIGKRKKSLDYSQEINSFLHDISFEKVQNRYATLYTNYAAHRKIDGRTSFSIFGKLNNMTCAVKTNAAYKMSLLILHPETVIKFSENELEALQEGRLGHITAELKSNGRLPAEFLKQNSLRILRGLRNIKI